MRDKLFTERFEVNLTKDQRQKLEKSAKEADMTMNEVIRDLINFYC